MEIGLNHPGNEELVTKVLHQIPIMRGLSLQHVSVLNKFKQTEPDMEFPALHKELFSIEGTESSWSTAGPVHWREKILFPWLRIVHEIWLGLVHKIACGIVFFYTQNKDCILKKIYTQEKKKEKHKKCILSQWAALYIHPIRKRVARLHLGQSEAVSGNLSAVPLRPEPITVPMLEGVLYKCFS